jgi:hypothetical protein
MALVSKAYGSEGGFSSPVDLPPGDYPLNDSDVVSVDGPANLTLPLGSKSSTGIIIHCKSGLLTILLSGIDTLSPPELITLTTTQAVQYSPVSSGWIVV